MTKNEFLDYLDSFNKDAGEFTDEELYQIGCKYKELPVSEKRWGELVEILGVDKTGEQFRIWIKDRQYANGDIKKNVQLLSGQTIEDLEYPEAEQKLEEIKQNLYIQQTKTRDTWNAYRRTLRDEARIDNMKDLIKESIKGLKSFSQVTYEGSAYDEDSEAILMFSDLHLGVLIDNPFNSYSVEIAKKRVAKLVADTVEMCQKHNVGILHICNLGDLIAGDIHITGRLEQEIDVIEQIMMAAEIVSKALVDLQAAAPVIYYRSVTDNHARLMPDIKQSIEKENLGKLIDWYIQARLEGTDIHFMNDNLDQEIGRISLQNGKTVIFVHGHHDNVNQICQNLTAYAQEIVDYFLVAHYHCEKMKTFQTCRVFVNGSIVGSDSYAYQKRLFSRPSQTLLIFEKDNLLNYSISLDIK